MANVKFPGNRMEASPSIAWEMQVEVGRFLVHLFFLILKIPTENHFLIQETNLYPLKLLNSLRDIKNYYLFQEQN